MLNKDAELLEKIRLSLYRDEPVDWVLGSVRFCLTRPDKAEAEIVALDSGELASRWHIRAFWTPPDYVAPEGVGLGDDDDTLLVELDNEDLSVRWKGKRGAEASRLDTVLKGIFNYQCGFKTTAWKGSFFKVVVVRGVAKSVYKEVQPGDTLRIPLHMLPPILEPAGFDADLSHVDKDLVDAMRKIFDANTRGPHYIDADKDVCLVNQGFNDYRLEFRGFTVATVRRWYLTLYPLRFEESFALHEALCAALFPLDPQDRYEHAFKRGRRTFIPLHKMKAVYFWLDDKAPRSLRSKKEVIAFEDANHYMVPTPKRIEVKKDSPEYLRAREDLQRERMLMQMPKTIAEDAAMREKAEKEAATQKMLDDLLGPIGG